MIRAKLKIAIVLGLLFAVALQSNAQETEQEAEQNQFSIFEHFQRTYILGMRYNDYEIAKKALYDMLALQPANDSIADMLSMMYLQNRQYASSALIANDMLERNPDNLRALEISANALEALGAMDKAVEAYEKLYLKTQNFGTLYKVTFLQFDLKRYTECASNLEILLVAPEADTEKVYYADENNQQKEFPIKVSLMNLKGLLLKESGDKDQAKKMFEAALAIAPDFKLAKDNLASLK